MTGGSSREAAALAAVAAAGGPDSGGSLPATAAADLAARLKPKPVTAAIRRRCQGTKGESATSRECASECSDVTTGMCGEPFSCCASSGAHTQRKARKRGGSHSYTAAYHSTCCTSPPFRDVVHRLPHTARGAGPHSAPWQQDLQPGLQQGGWWARHQFTHLRAGLLAGLSAALQALAMLLLLMYSVWPLCKPRRSARAVLSRASAAAPQVHARRRRDLHCLL